MVVDPNIFREYDIRGIVGQQLTDDTVAVLSRALGTYYRRNNASQIVVGYDARASSPRFCEILTRGLNESGCNVVLIGMVPTPVLYHALATQPVDGGVMITGSHNPPDHNGFKICLNTAALFGSQIREIGEIAQKGQFSSGAGTSRDLKVLDRYLDEVVTGLNLGPRNLKAVVDSGNGMGGVTAVPIYRKLGIDLVELFTEPDSTFPHHHPDPTVEENLIGLIAAVRLHKADVGLAFDGDGDRIGVVDETGRIIWGDELMVLFAREVLAAQPGATIISEVKCSQTLFDDIEARGGVPIMWQAGHSIIKAKMKETGAALAGEMSGHIFFADRYYGFDDAAYAGGRLLEILSKTDLQLSALLASVPKMYSTPELRTPCPDEIKFAVVQKTAQFFARAHDVNTIDGARISFERGWGLVRPSNTQAMLVLRFEADSPDSLAEIRNTVESKVVEFITAHPARPDRHAN
ncbi:MAG: phosphomannomutase/phosphoglucomutase [Pyrinomonadaceae bacterium]